MGGQLFGFRDETPGSQQMRLISPLFLNMFKYGNVVFTDATFILTSRVVITHMFLCVH